MLSQENLSSTRLKYAYPPGACTRTQHVGFPGTYDNKIAGDVGTHGLSGCTMYLRHERERARLEGEGGRKITLKVKTPQMIRMCEQAVEDFNRKQRDAQYPSLRKAFRKTYQDPWYDSKEDFKRHLDGLEQDALYNSTRQSGRRMLRKSSEGRR